MSLDELLALIMRSERADWLIDDARGISTHKEDLRVTIRLQRNSDRRQFHGEGWATNFADRNATVEVFELHFGASFVKDYHFCSVDGHRALLPYPKSDACRTITPEQYGIARGVDFLDSLDEYLQRARIEVVDE